MWFLHQQIISVEKNRESEIRWLCFGAMCKQMSAMVLLDRRKRCTVYYSVQLMEEKQLEKQQTSKKRSRINESCKQRIIYSGYWYWLALFVVSAKWHTAMKVCECKSCFVESHTHQIIPCRSMLSPSRSKYITFQLNGFKSYLLYSIPSLNAKQYDFGMFRLSKLSRTTLHSDCHSSLVLYCFRSFDWTKSAMPIIEISMNISLIHVWRVHVCVYMRNLSQSLLYWWKCKNANNSEYLSKPKRW